MDLGGFRLLFGRWMMVILFCGGRVGITFDVEFLEVELLKGYVF